jgi:hypothetical protein
VSRNDPAGEQLPILLAALDKLPPFHGLSYRGYQGRQGSTPQRMSPSGVLVPTSRDPRVATDNFTTDGVYAVIGRRGRDLSSLVHAPQEQEIVFRPGSMFLPIERFEVADLEVAVIEELDPDHGPERDPAFTLEELKHQMRSAVRESRARPEVRDVTPGKFVGPLR